MECHPPISGLECAEELYNAAPADSAPQSVMAKRDNSGYDNSVSNDNVIHSVSGSVGVVHNSNGGIRKPIPTRFDRPGGDYGQLSVTGTPKPPTTELDDLLISVKTTKGYHETRLEMIVKTWYQLAKEQSCRSCHQQRSVNRNRLSYEFLIFRYALNSTA
ncbi:hypothetical protein pipiens_009256 [Culex pipiens pipiens]|uniref:Fringe-like glycosyltransferase domain-containing protein n=1 Tax=Culex pipiens pipiens TaxID=38569 RepID=A0ABD1DEG4_CULPP